MGARFVKRNKRTRGEDDTAQNEALYKLVIDTDDVSGELLADGVSEEVADQLEEELSDLLETIGQNGSIEVVEVDENHEDDDEVAGESARFRRSARFRKNGGK